MVLKISMPVNFDDLQAFLFSGMSVFVRKYQISLEQVCEFLSARLLTHGFGLNSLNHSKLVNLF
jgi:hypothetical protein